MLLMLLLGYRQYEEEEAGGFMRATGGKPRFAEPSGPGVNGRCSAGGGASGGASSGNCHWSCLACTYSNHVDQGICEVCQIPRGQAAPVSAPVVPGVSGGSGAAAHNVGGTSGAQGGKARGLQ